MGPISIYFCEGEKERKRGKEGIFCSRVSDEMLLTFAIITTTNRCGEQVEGHSTPVETLRKIAPKSIDREYREKEVWEIRKSCCKVVLSRVC